ncbi:MAG TPA: LLM class flavin-dependent oxidoreductase [Solirubrobacterales bacterium]|nr:LLM class flavin-dependent oxidoreductase [Solirubrobacterales bacterium]
MRVGYLIDTHRRGERPPTPDERQRTMEAMIEEGIVAERSGFHSVQVPDRHANLECHFPGVEQLLTILARETERVALGSFTWVATLTHPMKAAEQFSLIDNLSRGRLFTTMSRGFLAPFWEQFGVPQERMLGRFKDSIAILREAVEQDRFSYEGEFWRVDSGRLAPRPFQEGGWPIWGGGNAVPAAIERCAEYAASWTSDPLPFERDAWEASANLYRRRARELGKEPFVAMMQDGWVADDFATAAATFGEHYARQVRFYQRAGILRHHRGFGSEDDITAESVGPHLAIGSADECIARLEYLHEELGVDYVTFCCRLSTGPSLAETREQIQRFGEEVVAPIHRRYPATDHPAIPAACRW